jgi:hypothetical protein
MEQKMTFNEINRHVESMSVKNAATATGQADAQDICTVYAGIRPILVAVGDMPLLPDAWKEGVKSFIKLLDSFCPTK